MVVDGCGIEPHDAGCKPQHGDPLAAHPRLQRSRPFGVSLIIKHYLIIDKHFTEDGAKRVIQSYQATLEFAEVSAESYDGEDEAPETEDVGSQPPPTGGKYTLPISPTQSITLWGNFPITQTEWEQMIAVIQAMRPALVSNES